MGLHLRLRGLGAKSLTNFYLRWSWTELPFFRMRSSIAHLCPSYDTIINRCLKMSHGPPKRNLTSSHWDWGRQGTMVRLGLPVKTSAPDPKPGGQDFCVQQTMLSLGNATRPRVAAVCSTRLLGRIRPTSPTVSVLQLFPKTEVALKRAFGVT